MTGQQQKTIRTQHGFTLVEISVVLLVLALITGLGLTVFNGVSGQKKAENLSQNFDAIESALIAYRKAHDRLPCPARTDVGIDDPSYGREDSPMGTCSGVISSGNTVTGVVPTRTLDLPDSAMLDAWGRRITYMVDKRLTEESAFTSYPVLDPNIGDITIKDNAGADRTTKAVVTLISHGPNGHGAFLRTGGARSRSESVNPDELENCDCDNTAATTADNNVVSQKEYQRDPGNHKNNFDDIVSYKMRFHFLSESEAAALSPAQEEGVSIPDIFVGFNGAPYLAAYNFDESTRTLSPVEFPDSIDLPANSALVSISQDKRYLAAVDDTTLRVYNMDTESSMKLVYETTTSVMSPQRAEFSSSPGNYIIITGAMSPTFEIHKNTGASFKRVFIPEPADEPFLVASGTAFSKDNNLLVVGALGDAIAYKRYRNSYVKLPNSGGEGFDFGDTPGSESKAMAFSEAKNCFVSASSSGVKLYKVSGNYLELQDTIPFSSLINAVAFSNNSDLLVTGSNSINSLLLYRIDQYCKQKPLLPKLKTTITPPIVPAPPPAPANGTPVLSNIIKRTAEGSNITFSAKNFHDAFGDPEGVGLTAIRLTDFPTEGYFEVDGTLLGEGHVITDVTELNRLVFHPFSAFDGNIQIKFEASDGSSYSAPAIIRIEYYDYLPDGGVTSLSFTKDGQGLFVGNSSDEFLVLYDVGADALHKTSVRLNDASVMGARSIAVEK